MSALLAVYGASGCGRGILPIARHQFPERQVVFVDDGMAGRVINGVVVLSWTDFLALPAKSRSVCIAIAAPRIREQLAQRCIDAGVPLEQIRHPSVVQMDDVELAPGACLSPYVTLTSNIRIGICFHANIYSYVEHDCLVGNFVTLAPAAKVNGNVTIGDRAYIGSGAVVRQGLTIGEGATVGMGAVVTRNVPANVTVVGNPARLLKKV